MDLESLYDEVKNHKLSDTLTAFGKSKIREFVIVNLDKLNKVNVEALLALIVYHDCHLYKDKDWRELAKMVNLSTGQKATKLNFDEMTKMQQKLITNFCDMVIKK